MTFDLTRLARSQRIALERSTFLDGRMPLAGHNVYSAGWVRIQTNRRLGGVWQVGLVSRTGRSVRSPWCLGSNLARSTVIGRLFERMTGG